MRDSSCKSSLASGISSQRHRSVRSKPPERVGSAVPVPSLLYREGRHRNFNRYDTQTLLAFAAWKTFSFDAFHLHDDSILDNRRNLAKLKAHERLANVFERRFELPWIARR
jgi:hypothetical protein